MTKAFYYRQVDIELRKKIASHIVDDGQSVVLLGARHSTKLNTIRDIHEILLKRDISNPVVYLTELHQHAIMTEQELAELLKNGVMRSSQGKNLNNNNHAAQHLFSPLEYLYEQARSPVILLMTNVDNMPHHITQILLRNVREYVEKRWLIVALTGEQDLQKLVHGPNSIFNPAHQYVLQGLTEVFMHETVHCIVNNSNFQLAQPEEACKKIWELVEGNVYLTRLMLRHSLFIPSHLRKSNSDLPTVIQTDWLPDEDRFLNDDSLFHNEIFVNIRRIVSSHPDSWTYLEELLEKERMDQTRLPVEPTSLELAGVAVRRITERSQALEFSSKLVKAFVKHFYNARHMGDLYLRNGLISKGFRKLQQIPEAERLRPVSAEDRLELTDTLVALQQYFLAKASSDPDATHIREVFCQTCRYVFGLPDVTFWEKSHNWRLVAGNVTETAIREYELAENLINKIHNYNRIGIQFGSQPLSSSHYTVVAILPSYHPSLIQAVVIGDLSCKWPLSEERRVLIHRLINDFIKALHIATEEKRQQISLIRRNMLRDILGTALMETRLEGRSQESIVVAVAEGLKGELYRRVLISLVDPEKKYIKGVIDAAIDSPMDVARYTEYPLSLPQADIQPYVVVTNATKIVPNAKIEPLANPDVVSATGMQAYVIVPIRNKHRDCIGTIHFERADNLVPTSEEIDDLETFAQHLGILLEQSQQLDLFRHAIQMLETPILIYDASSQLKYINQLAAEQLNCEFGWLDNEPVLSSSHEIERQFVNISIQQDRRQAAQVDHFINNNRTSFKVVVPLRSHNRIIGAVLEAKDISDIPWLVNVNNELSTAETKLDAVKVVMGSIDKRSQEWVEPRWLMFYRNQDQYVISISPQGIHNERQSLEWKPEGISDSSEPMAFFYDKYETLSKITNRNGIELYGAYQPPFEMKSNNEILYWTQTNVFIGDQVYGQMIVQYDEDLKPKQLFRMRLVLQALSTRITMIHAQEQAFEDAFNYLMHSINNRYSLVTAVYSDYEMAYDELNQPEVLRKANDRMVRAGNHFQRFVQGARLLNEATPLLKSPFALKDLVTNTINQWFPEVDFEVYGNEHAIVEVHHQLFEDVIIELTTNAIKENGGDLEIKVDIKDMDSEIILYFSDNGAGIPPEKGEIIFAKGFTQRKSTTSGSGLGLPYVKEIIEQHGGSIQLDHSGNSRGAKFQIKLPTSTKEIV